MNWRRRLFNRNRAEQQLDAELQFHLEQQVQDLVDSGMSEQEARRKARLTFGGLDHIREECRDTRSTALIAALIQDVRYAFRTFAKSRAFTVTAVLSIALGIGANTAIFTLMDALFWRWLPVRDPQDLVQLVRTGEGQRPNANFSYPLVRQLAEQKGIFAGLCGFSSANVFNTGSAGYTERIVGAWVSGEYHSTLGLTPIAGRLLTRDDDEIGAVPVAVITDRLWERNFARDPRIIGQSILIEGHPVTIIGVTGPGFVGTTIGEPADLTLPVTAMTQITPERSALVHQAGQIFLRVLARPQGSISPEQVKSQLAVSWSQLVDAAAQGLPANIRGSATQYLRDSTIDVIPGGTGYTSLRRQYRQPLLVLMTVVGLVLLIACTNVANLLLARGAAREREIAMRLAIGAGRGRLVRQLLTESMLLATTGAAIGLALAWFTSTFIVRLLGSGVSTGIILDLTPNWYVLAFTASAAAGTGILFGIVPAFRATAAGPAAALKQTSGSGGSRLRLIPFLVTLQVALSLVLLAGAGLFVRTLQNLRNFDPGFRREGVLLAEINAQRLGYRVAQLAAFSKEMIERFENLPGAASASASASTPLGDLGFRTEVIVKGQAEQQKLPAIFTAVTPRYFETMQIPVVLGRDFTMSDDANAAKVAIVNEAFVRRYLPDGNPIGRHISTGTDYEIVGVVKDAIAESLRETPPATLYVPLFQDEWFSATFEVRATGSLAAVSSAMRDVLRSRLPADAVQVRTLTADVEKSLIQERLMGNVGAGFGVLALLLASVGLYGSLAYAVSRRTREIGIRIAVGAIRRDVVWMILRQALTIVFIGILIGLPAAIAAARLASRQISPLLFGLKPTDPLTMAGAAVLLAAVATLAAYLPARRASRVDPLVALRNE